MQEIQHSELVMGAMVRLILVPFAYRFEQAHHGIVRSVHVAQLADNQALMELVHKVQEEPREEAQQQ